MAMYQNVAEIVADSSTPPYQYGILSRTEVNQSKSNRSPAAHARRCRIASVMGDWECARQLSIPVSRQLMKW
eukprot:m.638507 g.638507  ORF g.638507 m.638507 type:complete len:72 (-) comp22606_c1_seq8:446-661(-)